MREGWPDDVTIWPCPAPSRHAHVSEESKEWEGNARSYPRSRTLLQRTRHERPLWLTSCLAAFLQRSIIRPRVCLVSGHHDCRSRTGPASLSLGMTRWSAGTVRTWHLPGPAAARTSLFPSRARTTMPQPPLAWMTWPTSKPPPLQSVPCCTTSSGRVSRSEHLEAWCRAGLLCSGVMPHGPLPFCGPSPPSPPGPLKICARRCTRRWRPWTGPSPAS